MDEEALGSFIDAPAADLRVVPPLVLGPLFSRKTRMGDPSNSLRLKFIIYYIARVLICI